MTRQAALPPSIRDASFALEAFPDLPRSRTRCADLSTPSRGIRHPTGGEEPYADFCRPYLLVTKDSWLSHISAARMHHIPVQPGLAQNLRVHLARPGGAAGPRRRGVVGRAAYVAGLARVPGLPLARRSVDRLRVGVDSPPETALRLMLEDVGLPRFDVDCPVIGPDGIAVLWPDLSNEKYRVVIEYDGAHHLTPGQQFRDIQRDALTAELGWAQIKINRLDLRQGQWWVASKVEWVLERRGWQR